MTLLTRIAARLESEENKAMESGHPLTWEQKAQCAVEEMMIDEKRLDQLEANIKERPSFADVTEFRELLSLARKELEVDKLRAALVVAREGLVQAVYRITDFDKSYQSKSYYTLGAIRAALARIDEILTKQEKEN